MQLATVTELTEVGEVLRCAEMASSKIYFNFPPWLSLFQRRLAARRAGAGAVLRRKSDREVAFRAWRVFPPGAPLTRYSSAADARTEGGGPRWCLNPLSSTRVKVYGKSK